MAYKIGNSVLAVIVALFAFKVYVVHSSSERKDQQKSEERFVWSPTEWSNCSYNSNCNEPGVQRRSLVCLDSSGDEAPWALCKHEPKPSRARVCVPRNCRHNFTNYRLRIWPWNDCQAVSIRFLKTTTFSLPFLNFSISKLRDQRGKARRTGRSLSAATLNDAEEMCGSDKNVTVFVRRRNVSCLAFWPKDDVYAEVDFSNCLRNNERKPNSVELCSFGCRQNCAVSSWSDWQNCTICGMNVKYRVRKITSYSDEGIQTYNCPKLIKTTSVYNPGKNRTESRSTGPIQTKLSDWSPCLSMGPKKRHHSDRVFANVTLNVRSGVHRRSVTCVNWQGKNVQCANSVPRFKGCLMPRDCIVSDWSSWSDCSPRYISISNHHSTQRLISGKAVGHFYLQQRTREIVVTSIGNGKICPHLSETRACDKSTLIGHFHENINTTDPQNRTFMWFTGSWSQCFPQKIKVSQITDNSHCKVGIKRRSVFCVKANDNTHKPLGVQFCVHNPRPRNEAFCSHDCTETCIFGEWSSWSSCTADCDRNKTGTIRGTIYRNRKIISYLSDPRACLEYAESKPCTLKNCVSWAAGSQTVCLLDDIQRSCGNGKTHRAVYCLNARGHQVSKEACNGSKPSVSLSCQVPCPNDCVVGTWGPWGACEGVCGKNGTHDSSVRSRKRRILGNPGWNGRPCPTDRELAEYESCNGLTCGTYHWEAGSWGDCMKPSSRYGVSVVRDHVNRLCIVGLQRRSVYCKSNDGRTVQGYLCTSSLKPSSIKRTCKICSEDCMVSAWSEWSFCPSKCVKSEHGDKMIQKRKRFIMVYQRDVGFSCPKDLVQIRECESCKFREWKVSAWGACYVAPDQHCVGIKIRQVACVDQAGNRIDDHWCLSLSTKLKESEPCEVNCHLPCQLTEWSSWRRCLRKCGEGKCFIIKYLRIKRNDFMKI